jgi:enoyl-CoA hydratase/carnithine racemase
MPDSYATLDLRREGPLINQILCAQTSDFREGIGAFRQKRRPVWKDA